MTENEEVEKSFAEKFNFLTRFDKRDYAIGFLTALLIASLGLNVFQMHGDSDKYVEPEEAGNLTVNAVNDNILYPSPNNVTATLVNVTEDDQYGLDNFYRVRMNVTNPAGSQITSVYTKKDGSVAFLQFPRRLSGSFEEGRYH